MDGQNRYCQIYYPIRRRGRSLDQWCITQLVFVACNPTCFCRGLNHHKSPLKSIGKPWENHWKMGMTWGLTLIWLVVSKIFYDFPETVGNFMIPTDLHIFQRGRSTTNQWIMFLNALCSGPSY